MLRLLEAPGRAPEEEAASSRSWAVRPLDKLVFSRLGYCSRGQAWSVQEPPPCHHYISPHVNDGDYGTPKKGEEGPR